MQWKEALTHIAKYGPRHEDRPTRRYVREALERHKGELEQILGEVMATRSEEDRQTNIETFEETLKPDLDAITTALARMDAAEAAAEAEANEED